MKEKTISLFLKGIVIGIANMIAGISGGTLAYIVGVYENMISALANLTKKGHFWENFLYLLKIMLGIVVGILFMAKLLNFVLKVFVFGTICFFAGILIGGIINDIPNYMCEKTEKKTNYIIGAIVAFIIVVGMAVLNVTVIDPSKGLDQVLESGANNIETQEWPNALDMLILFVGIIFGAIAMIFPGISGSMVFMIFGIYFPVLDTIASLTHISNWSDPLFWLKIVKVMTPLLLGAIISLLFISKPINWLFKKYHKMCLFVILGFVAGSIVAMYIINFKAFIEQYSLWQTLVGILVMIPLGVLTSMGLHKLQNKMKQSKENGENSPITENEGE